MGDNWLSEKIKRYLFGDISDDEVKKRLYDNMNPYNYHFYDGESSIKRVKDAVKRNESEFDKMPVDHRHYSELRDDIYAEYLGIPKNRRHNVENKTIVSDANYFPTIGSSENLKKINLTDLDVKTLIDSGILLKHGENKVDAPLGYYFADHTVSRGFDNNGDYISYYDKWDINPYKGKYAHLIGTMGFVPKKVKDSEDLSFGIGNPTEYYDRVYLDDYYDIPEEARGNPFITPAVVTASAKHENGGILKAQEGTVNLYAPHPLSPVGIALNQAKAMVKGKTHLPPGVKEVVGPDGKKIAIRTEQPLVPLEQSIAEWIPGTGDAAEVGYIANDVKNGNYGTAALAAGLFLIPGAFGKILNKRRKTIRATNTMNDAARKANIAEYINNIDDTYIDPVHLERVAKSEQITRFNKFAKKYGYPEITDLNISNSRLDELTKDMLERHNTYYRGVVMTPEVEELAKTLNISNEEALKIAATTPRKGESHVFVSPTSNAGIYGGGTSAKIRRPYKLGSDRTKWFNEANFQIEPPYAYGGNPQAEVIYPWHRSYPETNVPNELLLKKGEFIEWMNNPKVDDYVGSNNRVFSNYDSLTGLEFLPLEKFKQGGKL